MTTFSSTKDAGAPKDKTGLPAKSAEVQGGPPSTRVADVGYFEAPKFPATTVLLQYDPAKAQWARLVWQNKPMRVATARPLVSLPGFRSVIQIDKGADKVVRLTLAGTIPEFYPGTFFLFDSQTGRETAMKNFRSGLDNQLKRLEALPANQRFITTMVTRQNFQRLIDDFANLDKDQKKEAQGLFDYAKEKIAGPILKQ